MSGYDHELARIVEELNRAAPGPKPAGGTRQAQSTGSLDPLLAFAARQNASDLLLVAGSGVALRVNGALAPASGAPLSGEDVKELVLPLLDGARYEELQRNK